MSGRHQPENGADSPQPDLAQAIAEYLVSSAYLDALKCVLCHGAGELMGGDDYQTCPKCGGSGS